jgi:excisionase family DNA binding protein
MSHTAHDNDQGRRQLLTVQQSADYLVCSRRTIERLIERGDLVPLHVGTRRRLRLDDLDRYVQRGHEK